MKIGDKVPAFEVQSFHANSINTLHSNDLLGKYWVLYFYPKDSTPGCTTEGNDFNQLYDQFLANNCDVFGVSRDGLKSHEKFSCKQGFRFPLIADEDEVLCQIFDVIKPKKMYGKEFIGIERSTFIIDKAGQLKHEFRKVKVKDHAKEVLSLIKADN